MNKKYEFTDETVTFSRDVPTVYYVEQIDEYFFEYEQVTLHRIKAIRDFGDVHAGDLGGWIETEENLSHDGNCWVSDDALVYDNANVSGNARVSDNAEISSNAKVSGNAHIYDVAKVDQYAKVADYAEVSGRAHVYGNAKIFDNARVSDNAGISGDARVYEYATIGRNVVICDNATVSGNVILSNIRVDKNCLIDGGKEPRLLMEVMINIKISRALRPRYLFFFYIDSDAVSRPLRILSMLKGSMSPATSGAFAMSFSNSSFAAIMKVLYAGGRVGYEISSFYYSGISYLYY